MVRVVGSLLLAVFLSSCLETHSCTEIGCSDVAGVTIQTANGEWAAGEYALNVAFDAMASRCTFTLPDDLPRLGSLSQLDCDTGLQAHFSQRAKCTEHKGPDGSSSQTCIPIPNQFDLEISQQGVPAKVSVELRLADAVLVDESHSLSYQDVQPNGPECGPVCRQASVKIAIP